MKLRTTSLAAIAAFTIAGSASGAVLLTDDFSGIDPTPNTYNVNYDLVGRQTGTQATQSWTPTNNVQVGNSGVFGGTGEYLQVALPDANAKLAGLTLSSSLVAADEKLVISFTADAAVTAGSDEEWLAFTLSDGSGNGWPVVGTGDFGFLLRANGGMQAFSDGGLTMVGPTFDTSASAVNLTFTFSGADGTGSAFAGNGSSVSIFDGTSTWSSVLAGDLSSEIITFRTSANDTLGMVDDLSIVTVPEPGAAFLGGLGMLALLRRRRP